MTETQFPSLPPVSEVVGRAQHFLSEDGSGLIVDETSIVPNIMQGLWIVSYVSASGGTLDGGALAVTADEVRFISSDPTAEEYFGVEWPEEEDEDDEIEVALALFAAEEFAAPGKDVDTTVCIMALPAEDDPVHGIGPEEKHATLLYFGDWTEHGDSERMQSSKELLTSVLTIAASEVAPFTATVTGVEPLGHDDVPAQVWLLDSPDLQRLFEEIPEIDSEVHSLYEDAEATRYPEYKPHVTIGYSDDVPSEALAVKEIRFDRLSLWWGDERIDVPLGVAEFDAMLDYFNEET